jgi:predicted KAP-like P-loop ATPase
MTQTSLNGSHKWHTDRAGELPEHDKLGRKDFATRVARELRAWHHKDSLVLSLNGDWGSGKTTLVNLILHYIGEQSKAAKEKPPNVVHFNPWQWSGQDKVLAAFFDEIGAGFRRQSLG